MSSIVLTTGAAVGALLGLFHAGGVYTTRLRQITQAGANGPVAARLRAGYGAFWTLALWTLFGTYVLVLWLLSVPLWLGHKTAKAV